MNKKNKPELTHFEQMERIEHRLAELSLIQKLLFQKYLDVAAQQPAKHQQLKEVIDKIPVHREKRVFGQPASYQEICQQLAIEDRQLSLDRKKLEIEHIQAKLQQQQRSFEYAHNQRMYEENTMGNLSEPVASTSNQQIIQPSILLLILSLILALLFLLNQNII